MTNRHGLNTEKISCHVYFAIYIIKIGFRIKPIKKKAMRVAHDKATGEKPNSNKK